MAETFYSDFTEFEGFDTMGVGEEALRGLYPDAVNRETLLRVVRKVFMDGAVSFEEAGDLLRLGESDEANVAADGSLQGGTIYEGLRHVKETSVAVRQELRAALFAAADAGA